MKLKEEQIRDLDGKCQVRRNDIVMGNQQESDLLPTISILPLKLALLLSLTNSAGDSGLAKALPLWTHTPPRQKNELVLPCQENRGHTESPRSCVGCQQMASC